MVVLKDFVKPDRPPAFTRFNLFLRDEFTCQYCGAKRPPDLRPRGAALARRAHDLGERRRRLRALQPAQGVADAEAGRAAPAPQPARPTPEQLQNVGRKFPPNHLHDSWMDYLYWDVELEA